MWRFSWFPVNVVASSWSPAALMAFDRRLPLRPHPGAAQRPAWIVVVALKRAGVRIAARFAICDTSSRTLAVVEDGLMS
jgi:hypothetical protein